MAVNTCINWGVGTIFSLDVSGLACARGGRPIFKGLDFRIEGGDALALEGANGAGKTSLLRMLAGFLTPLAGAITLTTKDGARVTDPEERARAIGWLSHLDGLKMQLTAWENLVFYAQLYGKPDTDIARALDEVGLARARDLPGQYLSAGMKKRLALARLKLSGRPLWLMDEPLAALDVKAKVLAAEMIRTHCAAGGMVIAATHEPLGLDCTKLVLGAA
jgi:heme exporter protein A